MAPKLNSPEGILTAIDARLAAIQAANDNAPWVARLEHRLDRQDAKIDKLLEVSARLEQRTLRLEEIPPKLEKLEKLVATAGGVKWVIRGILLTLVAVGGPILAQYIAHRAGW